MFNLLYQCTVHCSMHRFTSSLLLFPKFNFFCSDDVDINLQGFTSDSLRDDALNALS